MFWILNLECNFEIFILCYIIEYINDLHSENDEIIVGCTIFIVTVSRNCKVSSMSTKLAYNHMVVISVFAVVLLPLYLILWYLQVTIVIVYP